MNPCLKVSFARDKKESNLLDFDNILSIDISSSLVDAVEAYLWPKVSAMNRHQSEAVDSHNSKLNFTASRLHHDSEGSSTEAYMNFLYENCISNSFEVQLVKSIIFYPFQIYCKQHSYFYNDTSDFGVI